jgi:adenylate kinase
VVRTIPQAEGLDKLLAERGRQLDQVLFLDVSDAELLSRLEIRRTQESRADDDPRAVAVRLRAYREQTAPVIAWYEQHGTVKHIAAAGSVADVAARIQSALGKA